jgi:hypothetical protein
MTNRRKLLRGLLLIGLVLVAGWVWFTRLHTPALRIVEAGGRLTSDNLDISKRTLVVVPPRPGVLFSTVRKPGRQEQFTYVILFRYGPRIRSFDFNIRGPEPDCMLDYFGTWAETTAVFELNEKRIDASYRVELNETRTAVANESLTIRGKRVDMTSGQVFLIDLTTEPPVYRQMKVELPATPSKLETPEDAERAAEAIRQSLESQDLDIKAFLR